MSLAPDQIVARFEDAIEQGPDWVLSPHDYFSYPPQLDSGDVVHKAAAVGCLNTETLEGRQHRGARHTGAPSISDIRVRFLFDLRADARRERHREARAAEAELVKLLMAAVRAPELQIRFEGTPLRDSAGTAHLLIEVQFTAHHHYALQ